MKSKAVLGFIVIFMMVANVIMSVSGIAESQNLRISMTGDDGFVTEAGILFDSYEVTILDPNMDIRAYLVFRMIEINSYESLTNATLRLRTSNTLARDAGSTVTIYGVDDGDFNGFATASQIMSAPITSQYVSLDTSEFYGSQWWDIDVTDIVAELKGNPTWEGDDAFTGTIGFIFFGASSTRTWEGHDSRFFIDKLAGNGLEAQLIIHWGEDPEPPADEEIPPEFDDWEPEYVNTTPGHIEPELNQTGWDGELDIFKYVDYGDPMFQVYSLDFPPYDAWYFNTTKAVGTEYQWGSSFSHPNSGCATTPVLGLDPWTLIFADPGNAQLFTSDDEMVTSTGYSPNAVYTALDSYSANGGSMAIDPDGSTIHLVYTSVTPGQDAVYNVVYTNFTLSVTGVPTFAPTFTNLTQVGQTQEDPVIYVQPNGTLHVAWHGKQGHATEQVWYRRRHANGTWLAQVRVSDTDVGLEYNRNADVVANDETGDALIVWMYKTQQTHWDIVFPNNTASPADRVVAADARVPSMVNDRELNVANLVYQVTSSGVIYFRNMTISNSSTWSAAMQVSPGGQKHKNPDIGINAQNRSLSVVWYNDWNIFTAGNWWPIGATPTPGATALTSAPQQFLYNFIEEEGENIVLDEVWFVVFPNGTVIGGPYDTEEDAEDAVETIFDVDPEDPNPGSQDWEVTGPFTRFKTRLYIFLMGVVMIWGPVMVFASRRPTGYALVIGLFIMVIGLGFLIHAGSV